MLSRYLLLFVASTVAAILAAPALADDVDDYPPGTPLPPGYVRSIDAFTTGFTTADSLGLASQYASAMHNIDQAIALAKRALKKDDDDLDLHLFYAQALQAKLAQQKEQDPKLFNECLKEWLIVLRSERGEEKGLTRKNGKGNAKFNKMYEDEDHAIAAQLALRALVGKVPKANEADEKFVKKNGKQASLEVTGKVLPARTTGKSSDPVLWMK